MQDPILFWNEVAMEANRLDHTGAMEAENQRGPTLSSRALAIIHLAMHDAYFGIAGVAAIPDHPIGLTKKLYLLAPIDLPLPPANSLITRSAAVSGAASTALCTLYSSMRAMIEEKLAKISGENGTDDAAFSYGRRVALAVLDTRKDDEKKALPKDPDHVSSPGQYRHRVDPYNPTQGYLGVGYGKTPSFAVTTWKTLDAPPPKSDARYTEDFKEVYERGGAQNLNTTKRTPEQTAIGLYWAYDGVKEIGTPPRLYNQIVRKIAETQGNTEADNARLFALINCAMGDSGIHAWHWKYCFDLWRPIVGIREDDKSTGPAATADKRITPPCDPFWKPLGAPRSNEPKPGFTPPFPAYPSGHATFGAATFEMVRLFYGHTNTQTEDTIEFTLVSDELNGKTTDEEGSVRTRHARHYDSMAEAMYDNSVSRIYLGVHWRFDGTSGKNMTKMLQATDNIGGVPLGRAIATDIFNGGMKQQATPPTPPTGTCI
jgi:vanadium chloroperoxidase